MDEEIAACGLLCHECSIYKACSDREMAKKVRAWFVAEGFVTEAKSIEEFMDEGPYCLGCHGDRLEHWSPTCWILRCCVDEKGFDRCSECSDFPCDDMERWSKGDESYTGALERLKAERSSD